MKNFIIEICIITILLTIIHGNDTANDVVLEKQKQLKAERDRLKSNTKNYKYKKNHIIILIIFNPK